MLGVLISDIKNPFFPELISNFEALAIRNGYETVFANTNYDPDRMEHVLRRMLERRVEGVAILTSEVHESALDMLRAQNIPVVTLQQQAERHEGTITVDHSTGIAEAIAYLTGLGHRDIGFIAGPAHLWTAGYRRDLFTNEMKRRGLETRPEWIPSADPRPAGGMEAMRGILAQIERPTAIMASNDLLALGALRAINEAGYRVPADYSLIGIDDIDLVHYVHPPLTTIRVPRPDIAAEAFHTLVAGKDGGKRTPETLRTRLVVRGSTAAPRVS